MKKIYKLITLFSFTLFAVNANAATVTIGVGTDGSGLANQFFPSVASANVGDVIQFVAAGGPHNVTSGSIPGGAAAMSHSFPAAFDTYNYTVTVAGTYNYSCTLHIGMTGTINVAAVGILEPATDLLVTAYPNPFSDKITLKYGKEIESVKIFNVIGEQIKSIDLAPTEDKKEIYFEGIPSGIYFIRTYKEGTIVETKKIVKTK